jgi:polysaccharide biosynthesis protein PelG
LFYNAGIWADKFLFWYNPHTSHAVLGFMRASVIYDMPMFLAIITMIPGLAVFLFRMETDFVENYQRYYMTIQAGGDLDQIRERHILMIESARAGIFDIAKVQAMVILLIFIVGPEIMTSLGISKTYLYLFRIDVISTGLLVIFLGMQNVLFYLDRRHQALLVNVVFFSLNVIFTLISFKLGAFYYGYGFAAALFVSNLVTMLLLNFDFKDLEYETFMRV